jgi:hypothetical protein
MRRSTAIAIGAVVVAASIGAGTTAAVGAVGGSSSPSAKTQARHIADSLATSSGRARYDLSGVLVSAKVCVGTSCVQREFSGAPVCAPTASTCLGTALVVRRYAHGVTISAELA